MWVVKLGGSLARGPELRPWLKVLSGERSGRRTSPQGGTALRERGLVIVPGGGPFAERVRELQDEYAFDNASAHHMGILAMEQYGRMLAALEPGLVPVSSVSAIRDALRSGGVPVWMPARMTAGRADIPRHWGVTSDSLAAWLAGRIRASLLILVKSVEPPSSFGNGAVPLSALQEVNLVDKSFAQFVAKGDFEVRCVGPSGGDDLLRALEDGVGPGVRVEA